MRAWKYLPLTLCLASCAKSPFAALSSKTSVQNSTQSFAKIARPSCEINYVDYELTTNISAYEFTDTSGNNVGFDILNAILGLLGGSLDVSTAQVTMNMSTASVQTPSIQVNPVAGTASGEDVGLSGNIDFFSIFQLGFSYYSDSPVSKLTLQGLTNAFTALEADLAKQETGHVWQSKVIAIPDDARGTVVFQAGQIAGVQLGDTFKIYTTMDQWSGTPCASQLISETIVGSSAVATGHVISVDDFTSVLQIDSGLQASQIELGSSVQVATLVPAPKGQAARAPLGRSIALAAVTANGKLSIDGVNNIAIVDYTTLQLADVIAMSATGNRYYLSTLPGN